MPETEKGKKIKAAMEETYGEEKGEDVFYASRNKGTITGVDEGAFMRGELERDQLGGLLEGMGGKALSYGGKTALTKGATEATSGLSGFSGSTGGTVGGTVNTMINPYRIAGTASQAQENVAMGRDPSAGAFSATPSSSPSESPGTSAPSASTPPPSATPPDTGSTSTDRVVGRLQDYARAAGARQMADVEGPKGVLKPDGANIPEEKSITTTSAGGPSGTPDADPPTGGKSAMEKMMKDPEQTKTWNAETWKTMSAGLKSAKDNEMVIPGCLPEEDPIKQTKAGTPDANFPIRTGSAPRPSPNEAAWSKAGAEIKEKPPAPKMDMVGRRRLASDRPPDKVIGRVSDYARAAGARR